jgi:hypothetical protein
VLKELPHKQFLEIQAMSIELNPESVPDDDRQTKQLLMRLYGPSNDWLTEEWFDDITDAKLAYLMAIAMKYMQGGVETAMQMPFKTGEGNDGLPPALAAAMAARQNHSAGGKRTKS